MGVPEPHHSRVRMIYPFCRPEPLCRAVSPGINWRLRAHTLRLNISDLLQGIQFHEVFTWSLWAGLGSSSSQFISTKNGSDYVSQFTG
jgi:hypothetical protein